MTSPRNNPKKATVQEIGQIGRTLADSVAAFPEPERPRPGAPNVVMIVLDDLGFADFGCYGSAIETPNINRLADHGLRYNSFHVTSICSATRACLLTGRNHHAVGMGKLSSAGLDFRAIRAGFRGPPAHCRGYSAMLDITPLPLANGISRQRTRTPQQDHSIVGRSD